MDIIQRLKIEKQLEILDNLTDIAAELYGDLFVCEDKFWNSPTEIQMKKVNQELYELGYRIKPTLKEKVAAKIIMKERKRK
jgi:hypothetical protein